jgi:SH3 domain-containing YSC84-like protein 1
VAVLGLLTGTISQAVQVPVHDVTDYSALRSYINMPLVGSMDHYVFQATNIARSLANPSTILAPEKNIPPSILCNAAGIAILTVAKVHPWASPQTYGIDSALYDMAKEDIPYGVSCTSQTYCIGLTPCSC